MTYITYAPIDRQFGCLERDLPPGAPFNGIDPLDGITFGFALQSRYPLGPGVPDIRFGTVAKKPADNPAILLRVMTKAEYDAAYDAEMDARNAPALPGPPVITYKADVWRRSSAEQAAAIDTELTKLDVRMRRLWDDAQYLDHSTEEFLLLRTTMIGAFGQAEADRILAPSDA